MFSFVLTLGFTSGFGRLPPVGEGLTYKSMFILNSWLNGLVNITDNHNGSFLFYESRILPKERAVLDVKYGSSTDNTGGSYKLGWEARTRERKA